MGLYDRDYAQADYQSKYRYAPQMRFGFPRITPVVKWLLITNVAVYFASLIVPPLGNFIYNWLQLDATSLSRALQLWRLITYQFLHEPNFVWHIFVNMLGLFFLGPILERHWGSKKFLPFYLGCGVAGALFYFFLVAVGFLPGEEMIGASGAILGVFAACAILFPSMRLFLFPLPIMIPIRVAAIGGTLIYILLVVIRSQNAGGHAAHLAGMAAGAAYVFSQRWRNNLKLKIQTGRWQRKVAQQRNLQLEVDRILQKVHEQGIHSLTAKERRILKKATQTERMKNQF